MKMIMELPGFRGKGDSLADRATLTKRHAGVCSLGLRAPGRRISFFAYAQRIKRFTGPLQNGSVHLGNGNICYVSMNHFEVATATEQEKGIAKKETLLPTKRVIGIHPTNTGAWGGNSTVNNPGVSSKILISFCEPVDFTSQFERCKWNPLFPRFTAYAVTLSGSQAGNTLPLPRSIRHGGSPSCSPRWVPHCSQPIFAQSAEG